MFRNILRQPHNIGWVLSTFLLYSLCRSILPYQEQRGTSAPISIKMSGNSPGYPPREREIENMYKYSDDFDFGVASNKLKA